MIAQTGLGGGGGKNSFFFADLEERYLDSCGVRDGRASGIKTEERMFDALVDFLLEGATGGPSSSSGKASRIMRVRWACSRMRGMGGGAGVASGWT